MPGFVITSQDSASGPSPTVEVGRSHRFTVSIEGSNMQSLGVTDVCYYAMTVSRPSIEFDQIKMHQGPMEINIPGKYRFSSSTIKFYEAYDLNGKSLASVFLNKWITTIVTTLQQNALNLGFRRTMNIRTEGGCGELSNLYILANAWPNRVDPVDLDYTTSNISTVSTNIVCDAVKLE